MLNIKKVFQKNNIFLVLILTITPCLYFRLYQLSWCKGKELFIGNWQVEGLNISFSIIQTLGSEFILSRDILIEVLDLFQKNYLYCVVDHNEVTSG